MPRATVRSAIGAALCSVAAVEAIHFAFLVKHGVLIPPHSSGHGAGLVLRNGQLVPVYWDKQSPPEPCFGVFTKRAPRCNWFSPHFWANHKSPWQYWTERILT